MIVIGKPDENERKLLEQAIQQHGDEMRVSLREFNRIPEKRRGIAFEFIYDRAVNKLGSVSVHVDNANEMIVFKKRQQ